MRHHSTTQENAMWWRFRTVSPLLLAASLLLMMLHTTSAALSLHASAARSKSMQHATTSRRDWFGAVVAAASSTAFPSLASATENGDVTLFTTSSGLKYIDIKEGTSVSPRYGQLCSIKYTGYIALPNKEKQKFDSAVFLIKHGNGRAIAGLDEGLHTMKVGGVRRLIIPPKLGYVQSGIGPIPESPFARGKLGSLLDDMVAVKGGNVIFDVELRSVISDEADQGYYEDYSLTPDEFNTLRNNLQRKAADALSSGKSNVDASPPDLPSTS